MVQKTFGNINTLVVIWPKKGKYKVKALPQKGGE